MDGRATKLVLKVGSAIAETLGSWVIPWAALWGRSPVSAGRQPLLAGGGKLWSARMSTTQRTMIVAFKHRHAIYYKWHR